MPVTLAIDEYFAIIFEIYGSIPNIITSGLWSKLSITENQKRGHYLKKELDTSIMAHYHQRKADFGTVDNTRLINVLDIIVEHNIVCEKSGRSTEIFVEDRIIGNTVFFHLAGYNTSNDSMTTGMTFAAERPDWIEKCVKDGLGSCEDILGNVSLQYSIKEILRVCPPIPTAIPRLLVKDCVVDGVPLKKGDYVTWAHGGLNEDPDWHPDAKKYWPERYLDTERIAKNPKQVNIPFGLGKRSCLGKELAWIEVMIYIGSLFKAYEFRTPEGFVRNQVLGWGYRCQNPYLECKIRN
jgi:cytochrome P450